MLKSSFDAASSHMAGVCNCMSIRVEVRAYGCKEVTVMVLRACGHKEDTEGVAGVSRHNIEALGHKEDTIGVAGASQH